MTEGAIRRFKYWNEAQAEDLICQILGMPLGSIIDVASRSSLMAGGDVSAGIWLLKVGGDVNKHNENSEVVSRELTMQLGLSAVLDNLRRSCRDASAKPEQIHAGDLVWIDAEWTRAKWDVMRYIATQAAEFRRAMSVAGSPDDKNWDKILQLELDRSDDEVTIHSSTGRKPGIRWLSTLSLSRLRVGTPKFLDGPSTLVGLVQSVSQNPVQLPRWRTLDGFLDAAHRDDKYWFDSLAGPVVEVEPTALFQDVRMAETSA